MYTPVRIATTAWLSLVGIVAATMFAQGGATQPPRSPGTQADVTAHIVASAQAVLTTLDEAGRAKVQFPVDAAQRTNWSNLPSPMFQRNGLRMGDLTSAQRASVMALLAVALSRDGYRKVGDIMRGDEVLRTTQQSGGGRGAPNDGGGRARGRGMPA